MNVKLTRGKASNGDMGEMAVKSVSAQSFYGCGFVKIYNLPHLKKRKS